MKYLTGSFSLLFLLLVSVYAYGGNDSTLTDLRTSGTLVSKVKISGKVVDENEKPLSGANVVEEGTTNGVIAGANGNFTILVADSSILNISFIGYKPKAVPVRGRQYVYVKLSEDVLLLDDIIVTALGLKRKESALTYSAKQVDGEELTRVKEPNMIFSLAGKVAGMQVNKTSSGLGSSAKVLMRGIRSVAGNNQPLYVIDGVPVLNTSNEQAFTAIGGTADAGNRDGGDGISNLNPEDVESISVLKGSPAAALYGSQAANGVILITTKKGRGDKREITFSTNLTFDKSFCLPEFQNTYGESDGVESWGKKQEMPTYDNAGDFFRTGLTSMTSLSVSTGNEHYQTYFSYANTTGKGIIENNKLNKHNINFRETTRLLDNRLMLDANINLFRQIINDRSPSGGFYMNSLVGLYRFPRGKDITEYRDHFEVWDDSRNMNVQNWHSGTEDFEQNPYWVVNRIRSKDVRNRTMASLTADLKVTDWFRLQARGSADNVSDKVRQKFYASTAPALAGMNGRYIEADYQETMFYGDIMGMFEKKFRDFSLQGAVGASINDKTVNSLRYDSKTASLKYANVFNIANINMNGSAYIDQQIDARRQMQSVFATAQVGYKESLIIDLTARNDWASTLAYTPNEGSGFFYPSVGAAWIMNKMLAFPEWV
ncbi:SusC/RagA family TonB-linked outer membrane protein, partial [uncultured Parabacteroides sp.]